VNSGRVNRRGVALLEVLVALAVLGLAGLALVEVSAQALRALDHAEAVERRIGDEDRLLAAYSLLNRRDLGQRAGLHRVGPYDVRVDRLDLALFRITVGPAGEPADLATAVYRIGGEYAE
jgi:type II secretory pathway component PulJ